MLMDGVLIDNYSLNPIVLWQHDSSKPIGKAISLTKSESEMLAVVDLFVEEYIGSELEPIIKLILNEKLTAASIGFIPYEIKSVNENGMIINEIVSWELVEFSVVSVPANPKAVKELSDEEPEIPDEIPPENEIEKAIKEFDFTKLLSDITDIFHKSILDVVEKINDIHKSIIPIEKSETEIIENEFIDNTQNIEKITYENFKKLIKNN
jgi:HK97 family phage prohead protease